MSLSLYEKKLSNSSLSAINAVRSSGGDVSEYAIDLLRKIDAGEITVEEAVKKRIAKDQVKTKVEIEID